MKFLVPLFIAIAVCSAGVVQDPTLGYKDGDRYFYFPGDGDNQHHLVDSWEPVDVQYLDSYFRNPENNAYWLFTRENPSVAQILVINDEQSVRNSLFNPAKTRVFLSHGWNGNGNNEMNKMLTEAFLQNDDVNVIVLDWRRLANRNYVTAKNGVPGVGKGLGQFINWLTTLGLQYERTHLVGFSLGGHLVGHAGRETGGRVQRVTALDPAGPLYYFDSSVVAPSDGQYVEVIHTNTAFLGYSDPLGDADFYPNGGSSMPGCWINTCSHGRAYEYMASSVKHDHLHANACETLRDATRDRCNGDLNPMGNTNLNKGISGIFRVNTGRNYPY